MARDSGQARQRARRPVRLDGPRSAHMGRRGRPPELQIRSAFEATRTAAQCLAGVDLVRWMITQLSDVATADRVIASVARLPLPKR